jgi:hypothetical protein
MSVNNRYKYQHRKSDAGVQIQSKQEELIHARYPNLQMKPDPVLYVTAHRYLPDAYLGNKVISGTTYRCYLELKEFLDYNGVPKYEAIVASNPDILIHFLIKSAPRRTINRLAKTPQFIVAIGYDKIPAEWLACGTVILSEDIQEFQNNDTVTLGHRDHRHKPKRNTRG